MATLNSLKRKLRQEVAATMSSSTQPLSDTQYRDGFEILLREPGWDTYQEFIIPQLSQLLSSFVQWRIDISILEIGPGQKSVCGYLPRNVRQKVRKYSAFEPNSLFATSLEEWFRPTIKTEYPLPCLESEPKIYETRFSVDSQMGSGIYTETTHGGEKFDVILFCHSIYSMKPKHKIIEVALKLLAERADGGMIIVFHRDGTSHLDGFVCHRMASFPMGVTLVENNDEVLNSFAPFVAGLVIKDLDLEMSIQVKWRKICRTLGHHVESHPDHLLFSSPNIMVALNRHATSLPELAEQVPLVEGETMLKNREANLCRPALHVRPTKVEHVQQCIRWAVKHEVALTVIGGGHSSHCCHPNVVAIDMSAFTQIQILKAAKDESDCVVLVAVESGCKTGDIIRKTMEAGITIPLGFRPSVGAGLWLQGGIGHLSRLYGLTCDSIIGAVVVSVASGEIFCVGRVPSEHKPVGAVYPEEENSLLWAIKGAATNFCVVVSVIFRAYAAPTYTIRKWIAPLSDNLKACRKLSEYDKFVTKELPRDCSADAYLYWDKDQLHLGVTTFGTSTNPLSSESPTSTTVIDGIWGRNTISGL